MTVQSATVTLLELINQNAASSRLNTIDQALSGSGIGQKNFKGTWQGYSQDNKPTVKVNGRIYNVDAVAFSGKKLGDEVTVRAGKDTLTASWR
jgi:hypothetical protein